MGGWVLTGDRLRNRIRAVLFARGPTDLSFERDLSTFRLRRTGRVEIRRDQMMEKMGGVG